MVDMEILEIVHMKCQWKWQGQEEEEEEEDELSKFFDEVINFINLKIEIIFFEGVRVFELCNYETTKYLKMKSMTMDQKYKVTKVNTSMLRGRRKRNLKIKLLLDLIILRMYYNMDKVVYRT